MSKHWMQQAFSKNKGKLHRELGVPEGHTIPASKLAHAPKRLAKQVALARTGKKYGGGKEHPAGKLSNSFHSNFKKAFGHS